MPILGFTASDIASLCNGAHQVKDGSWRAQCPGHNGEHDSFTIRDGPDGVNVECHSKACSWNTILIGLGIDSRTSLNGTVSHAPPTRVVYPYVDANDTLLFEVVRTVKNGEKRFYQRRPNPDKPGDYINNMVGVERVLYHLPQLIKAIAERQTILIVEGEKDVHTAEELGFTATTNAGGAEKWDESYSEALRGANVVIIPDNDDPGRKHAQEVIKAISDVAASVRLLKLPGVPPKGDLTDWVEQGHTAAELEALIESIVTKKTDDTRPVIYHDPRNISASCDAVESALIASGAPIWQRDGLLVSIQVVPRNSKNALRDDINRLRIVPATTPLIQRLATDAAQHMTRSRTIDETIHYKPNSCPKTTIEAIETYTSWNFKSLSGVVTVPTLRRNGSVIDQPGYDEDTGLFYEPGATFPEIVETPTRDDAKAALATLDDVFCDVWFAEDCHKSATIAAILTIMARHLIDVSPLFSITSNTRGIGKGLLANCVSVIAMGAEPALSGYPRDDAEMEKQLLVMAMNGDQIVVFDNITGVFGGSSIDKAITGARIKGRLLGQSKNIEASLQTTFIVTGNNIKYRGDTARRVVPITLLSKTENPEERDDFKRPELKKWVEDSQPLLHQAALTILSAYMQARRPSQGLTPYGSFEAWSGLVRSALVWAGASDPCEGRKAVEAESDNGYEELRALLVYWREAYPDGKPRLLKDIVGEAKRSSSMPDSLSIAERKLLDLGEALTAFDPKSGGKVAELAPRRLAQRLPVTNGESRIIDNMQLCSQDDPDKKGKRFLVRDMGELSVPETNSQTEPTERERVLPANYMGPYGDDDQENTTFLGSDDSIPF